MFIRAKNDFECPSHKVPKGAELDLVPDRFALEAIANGDAVAMEPRDAIKRLDPTKPVYKRKKQTSADAPTERAD